MTGATLSQSGTICWCLKEGCEAMFLAWPRQDFCKAHRPRLRPVVAADGTTTWVPK